MSRDATHRDHPSFPTRRSSDLDKVVNRSASVSPSGRNLSARSKRRPRITSSSISQYTRLEARMQRAYRSVGMALMSETRSEEHTSELQSHVNLVCRLLLEKKKC